MTTTRTFLDSLGDCMRLQFPADVDLMSLDLSNENHRILKGLVGETRLIKLWWGTIDGGNCWSGLISVKEEIYPVTGNFPPSPRVTPV